MAVAEEDGNGAGRQADYGQVEIAVAVEVANARW